MESSVNESARSRAWKDTKASFRQLWFFWGVEVGVMGLFAYLADKGYLIPNWHPAIWTAIGAGIGYLGIFTFNLIRAPYRQRDEARELVEQQRKPSDSEVIDAIGLLKAETLVLKNDEKKESSYSFSQVFLALADQLSIGIPSIQFEGKIRKGLNIDERGSWYFPHEDEGITHLIGVLTQSNLVDRRSEEYQHMVTDYPQDIGEIAYNIIRPNMFRPKPPQHLERGTEVKYYLSPLGSMVIQQLRQQSVAHKKGSQSE